MLTYVGGEYCRRCGCDVSQYAVVGGTCPQCQGLEIHFDKITRAGVYAGSLRSMVLRLKHDRTELRESLGQLVKSALESSGFADDIDTLVPVPLHWLRRLARGYNQSLLIAKQLKQQGVKIVTDLVRIRNTRQQAGCTSPAQRAKNVAGAFAVRRGHPFAGKNICLIDDIKTSGATLNECAKVLKEAGAAKVFAAVIAVAGQGP
jgi:competence protein ComFC